MSRKYRFVLFLSSIITLLVISYIILGNLTNILSQFWFSSGILLLILLSLIDQPHFSKDANIFVNAVTASISLLLVPVQDHDWIFWLFSSVSGYLAISSYVLFWVRNNPLNEEMPIVQFISRLNRIIGKPETIFSAFFLWGAIKQFGLDSSEIVPLFWYWFVFMLLNIPQIASTIEKVAAKKQQELNKNVLGNILGVQAKNIFLVKLFPINKRQSLRIFDFVEFKYSADKFDYIRRGIILDNYFLDEEQWIKVLNNKEVENTLTDIPKNEGILPDIVYKLCDVDRPEYAKKLVGVITENSDIGKVRFIHNSSVQIKEGQLLTVIQNTNAILYQVINGITKIDQLQNKNQSGYVIGEAIQLGTWNTEKYQFEKYGWVPEVNNPVYLANDIGESKIETGHLLIGFIPETKYPVILNMETAITHHMAILGVTGTGKSIFSRNLIRKYIENDQAKIIVVDFTGEYSKAFPDLVTSNIVTHEEEDGIYKAFEAINTEQEKFANQQNKDLLQRANNYISSTLNGEIDKFINDDARKISIIELPDVSNTTNILEYTKRLFTELFKIAKSKKGSMKRICIVLEEAHTVVPEWNFSGEPNKASQNVLNSIAQIALQGRKYNIGLLVIAQRTANVSKTILTQCNTVVSFQEFDKTSIEFLSNYFGEEIAAILPNLQFRRAIAAGKGFKANTPMIFEVPFIDEKVTL